MKSYSLIHDIINEMGSEAPSIRDEMKIQVRNRDGVISEIEGLSYDRDTNTVIMHTKDAR